MGLVRLCAALPAQETGRAGHTPHPDDPRPVQEHGRSGLENHSLYLGYRAADPRVGQSPHRHADRKDQSTRLRCRFRPRRFPVHEGGGRRSRPSGKGQTDHLAHHRPLGRRPGGHHRLCGQRLSPAAHHQRLFGSQDVPRYGRPLDGFLPGDLDRRRHRPLLAVFRRPHGQKQTAGHPLRR